MSPLVWIVVLLGCAATFDDFRRRAIANRINLTGIVAGLMYHLASRGMAESGGGKFCQHCGAAMAAACLLWHWRVRAIPYAPALSLGAWLALLGRG